MEFSLTNYSCYNNHKKPISKIRMNKQISEKERFMCELCDELQNNDQSVDISNIQLMIQEFKNKQREQIQIFTQFKLKQIEKIENNILQLKTNILRYTDQLIKYIQCWREQVTEISAKGLVSDFIKDVNKLIQNKWDDELEEYFLNFEDKNSCWIQKIEMSLDPLSNFKESQNCKNILKESIILKDISPVRVRDNSISLTLINDTCFQNETCNAISINKSGSIIASSKENNIIIWEFRNGKIKFQTHLDRHMDYVTCLVFSKKRDSLISASQDKTIFIWQQLNLNKWICSSLNFQHNGTINCILLNNNENQLISGSSDQKILIWNVDLNENKLFYSYQLQLIAGDVEGLTMNQKETILVSCQLDKSILIWRKGNDDKWKFSSTVTKLIDEYGSRIIFLNDTSFIWVSGEREGQDCICEFQEREGFFSENQINRIGLTKNNKEYDFHLFPIIYNNEKHLIVVKQKMKIYILKQYPDEILKIAGVITCKSTRVFGSLTNDGEFLIYWDSNGKQGGGGQYFIYKI